MREALGLELSAPQGPQGSGNGFGWIGSRENVQETPIFHGKNHEEMSIHGLDLHQMGV